MAFGVGTVTGGAKLFVQALAGRHIGRRKLFLIRRQLILGEGAPCDKKQSADQKCAADNHHILPILEPDVVQRSLARRQLSGKQ